MNKFIVSFCISLALLSGQSSLASIQNMSKPEKVIPSYAKWGILAVKETRAKYADAQIIDYLHIGKQNSEHATIEKFKLWLKRENKEFGVFVNITFDTKTEDVIQITFTETDR